MSTVIRTLTLALGLLLAGPAWAQHEHHHGAQPEAAGAVGATVEELIAIARTMSPEVQISALEADAALAKVDGAGSLADPKVSLSIEDWSANRNGGSFPSNPASNTTKKLKLSQELPFPQSDQSPVDSLGLAHPRTRRKSSSSLSKTR